MGINKVILLGRIGKDPDIRYTPEGVAVSNFSIATSEKWRNKISGEIIEKTEWHQVVALHKLGEMSREYLLKGDRIYVEGRLRTRSWKQNGIIQHVTEVIATYINFIDNKDNYVDYSK